MASPPSYSPACRPAAMGPLCAPASRMAPSGICIGGVMAGTKERGGGGGRGASNECGESVRKGARQMGWDGGGKGRER